MSANAITAVAARTPHLLRTSIIAASSTLRARTGRDIGSRSPRGISAAWAQSLSGGTRGACQAPRRRAPRGVQQPRIARLSGRPSGRRHGTRPVSTPGSGTGALPHARPGDHQAGLEARAPRMDGRGQVIAPARRAQASRTRRPHCSHAHRAALQARSGVAHGRHRTGVPGGCGVPRLAPAPASPRADVTSPRLSEGCPRPPLVGAVRWRVPDAAAHREVDAWHRSWTRRPPIRRATCRARHRRAIVALSKLSRLGRVQYALALLTALATSGAVRAHAASSCGIGYPFKSSDPRTDVSFNESEVLRAFSPQQSVNATPGLTIKVWYNDEHALTLGVRRVIVQTKTGTTTTDYPVSALPSDPGSALHPQVGTTALDGAQAGTDTSACSGDPDLCDRPMFPALFLTDISSDPNSTAGDWQHGGTPIPPHAVFGTWKAAVRTVDETHSPAVVTVTPDNDPAKNDWNLGGGDPVPSGLSNQGYGAEVRWNVDDLVAAGQMIMGHTYRMEFMVHDGDQNQNGGDAGEDCVGVRPTCAKAADCNDQNPCPTDSCNAGVCQFTQIAGCRLCSTASDCDDQNACTTDSCSSGVCQNTAIAGCTPCTTASDCDDGNACTIESCNAGVCQSSTIAGCTPCSTAADCNDGNACTLESCDGGVCSNTLIEGCRPCTTVTDCDDQNACTTDTCDAGVCDNTAIAGCTPCSTVADCNDGNACTIDTCDAGVCHNTAITCTSDTCNTRTCNGTSSCTVTPNTGAACDDGNTCTFNDTCHGSGQCVGTAITCTSDTCNTRTCNGTASCTVTPLTGTTCDDGNAGTCSDT